MIISRYSMARICLPFMAGILSASYVERGYAMSLLVFITCFVLMTLAAWWFRRLVGYRYRWIPGVVSSIAFASLGYVSCLNSLHPISGQHYKHYISPGDSSCCILRIVEKPNRKVDRSLVFAEVVSMVYPDTLIPCFGRVRITVRHDTGAVPPLYPGTYWMGKNKLQEVQSRLNPWGFDYGKWLAYKGVRHVMHLNNEELHAVGATTYSIRRWGMQQQARLMNHIEEMGLDSASTGMAGAMLFGEKSSLQADDHEAFRKAGVMHVLCVSGLHAGAVYAGTLFLISLVMRGRRSRRYAPILALIPILAFASITGLAPSVCRASLMLGLHAFGRLARRRTEGVNILPGAALVMLWNQPTLLFDLGFQFSFLAVASILLLAIPASRALGWKGKGIVPAIGGLALVSLGAQAGTAPLSLFHFHTFPLYFLPANLLVVPVSTIVIYTGMISVLLQLGGICPVQVHMIFRWLVDFMGLLVRSWGALPGASISDIPFRMQDALFMYSLLGLLSAMLFGRSGRVVKFSFMILIAWSAWGTVLKLNQSTFQGGAILSVEPLQWVMWKGKNTWYIDDSEGGLQPGQQVLTYLQAYGLRRDRAVNITHLPEYTTSIFSMVQKDGLRLIDCLDGRMIVIPRDARQLPLPPLKAREVYLLLSREMTWAIKRSVGKEVIGGTIITDYLPRTRQGEAPGAGNMDSWHALKNKGCFLL